MPDRRTITLSLTAAVLLLVPLPASAAHKQTSAPAASPSATSGPGPSASTPSPTNPGANGRGVNGSATAPPQPTAAKRVRARASSPGEHPQQQKKQRTILAHLASDPSDTIADFSFSPGTITIHVGDAVTWTNAGPSQHTATANGGSFDTGTLSKGQSGSHTFNQAGTFGYFCRIHPFMHGTVVVLAAAGSGTSTGGSSSAGGTASSSGTTGSSSTAGNSTSAGSSTGNGGQSLPNTGSDVGGIVLLGLLLVGSGLAVRRRGSARSR
jgi:LPXTG-motif cell wall-anchored protein